MKQKNHQKIIRIFLAAFIVLFGLNFILAFGDANCDSGTLADTCLLNHTYSFFDGENINGSGSLLIGTNGSIINYTSNASATNHGATVILNFTGVIEILNKGNISGGNITITAANLTINMGSKIYTQGFGYMRFLGQGATGFTGASHGGTGGGNPIIAYGSSLNPSSFGSGGGDGGGSYFAGSGGGIIRLNIGDTFILNGTINADGNGASTNYACGGSGGSVYASTKNLIGNGNFSSKGGNCVRFCYGAGGGRIAVYYNTSTYTGISRSSVAGAGAADAGFINGMAGSAIFIDEDDSSSEIPYSFRFQGMISPANETGNPNRSFWNTNSPGVYNFTNLTVYGGAILISHNISLNISANYFNVTNSTGFSLTYAGISPNLLLNVTSTNLNENLTNVNITYYGNLNLHLPFAIRILNNSEILTYGTGAAINLVNKFNPTFDMFNSLYGALGNQTLLNVGINDNVQFLNLQTSSVLFGGFLNISLTNLTLDISSSINGNGLGFPSAMGSGVGSASSYGGGAGHGGRVELARVSPEELNMVLQSVP